MHLVAGRRAAGMHGDASGGVISAAWVLCRSAHRNGCWLSHRIMLFSSACPICPGPGAHHGPICCRCRYHTHAPRAGSELLLLLPLPLELHCLQQEKQKRCKNQGLPELHRDAMRMQRKGVGLTCRGSRRPPPGTASCAALLAGTCAAVKVLLAQGRQVVFRQPAACPAFAAAAQATHVGQHSPHRLLLHSRHCCSNRSSICDVMRRKQGAGRGTGHSCLQARAGWWGQGQGAGPAQLKDIKLLKSGAAKTIASSSSLSRWWDLWVRVLPASECSRNTPERPLERKTPSKSYPVLFSSVIETVGSTWHLQSLSLHDCHEACKRSAATLSPPSGGCPVQ